MYQVLFIFYSPLPTDLDRSVRRAGRQTRPVRVKPSLPHRAVVVEERVEAILGLHVPETHGLVVSAGGGQTGVGAARGREYNRGIRGKCAGSHRGVGGGEGGVRSHLVACLSILTIDLAPLSRQTGGTKCYWN